MLHRNGTTHRDGTCGRTAEGPSDCSAGSQGNFASGIIYSSWSAATASCVRQCEQCERCSFVSLSLKWRDCSWFSGCADGKLDESIVGFRSFKVKQPQRSKSCGASPPTQGRHTKIAKAPSSSSSRQQRRHPSADPALLLGIFSFASLAGAHLRRHALRRLVLSSVNGGNSGVTARFVIFVTVRAWWCNGP